MERSSNGDKRDGFHNRILEAVVVTPKAADEGKRVALVPGLLASRMLCKLKHFLKHHKVPAACPILSRVFLGRREGDFG